MVRILHIGLSPNKGGLESFVLNMFRNIDRSRYSFDFVNTSDDPLAYEDLYRAWGAQVFHVTPRRKDPIRSRLELQNVIRSGNYDYVHYHCMTFCWPDPLLTASSCKGTQAIAHSHLTGFNKNTSKKEKLLHAIGKFRLKNTDMLRLACGKEAGNWLFPDKAFTVIENGIDIEKYSFSIENRKKIRERYGYSEDDIVIGHVGNFSYQKNYPYLLQVFEELHKIDNHYRLLLVGNDALAADVKKALAKSALDPYVIFAGMIDNVNELYSAMDLYVFPSHYEGLNISLIEAQTSGLDCFVSDKLDKDSNVGGKYHYLSIDDDPANSAQMIHSHRNPGSSRDVRIQDAYNIISAVKKLEQFYAEHLHGGSNG